MAISHQLLRSLTVLAGSGALWLFIAGCGDAGDPIDGGVSDTGGDVTESDGEPATCGGPEALECDPGFYCDYPDDSCGDAGATGACRSRPEGCDDVFEPVCACDGGEYENACSAAAAGVDVGPAECASGSPFACGDSACDGDGDAQYCSVLVPGVPGSEPSYDCAALPDDCSAPSCECFTGPACDCAVGDDGNVTVTCYAP